MNKYLHLLVIIPLICLTLASGTTEAAASEQIKHKASSKLQQAQMATQPQANQQVQIEVQETLPKASQTSQNTLQETQSSTQINQVTVSEKKIREKMELEKTIPDDNKTDVPLNGTIRLIFSKSVKTIRDNGFHIFEDGDSQKEISFESELDGPVVTLIPDIQFKKNTKYVVRIDQNAVKTEKGTGNNGEEFSFTTGEEENEIPKIVSEELDPIEDNVPVKHMFTFHIPRGATIGNFDHIALLDDSERPITYAISVRDGGKILIKPDKTLKKRENYVFVFYPGAIIDEDGVRNELTKFEFTTEEASTYEANLTIERKKSATFKLSGGEKPYEVKSSNKNIVKATVKGTKLTLSGVSNGKADITVSDDDGNQYILHVTVMDYELNLD